MSPDLPHRPSAPGPAAVQPDPASRLVPAAIALSVATVVAIAGVALVRWGFTDSLLLQLVTGLQVLAAIWLPLAVLASGAGPVLRWLGLSVAVAATAWLPALGLLAGPVALGALLLTALLAFVLVLRARVLAGARGQLGRGLALGILLGSVLVVAGSVSRYQMPEAVRLGLAHSDAYFHLSIAQMLAHFGIPSIGADGLLAQRYHFGSHLVAAGLAQSTGAGPALAYVYWGTLALPLQLLWALLCAAAAVADQTRRTALPAGALMLHALAYLAIGSAFLASESFVFGLTLFIGSVPLLALQMARGADAPDGDDRLALAWIVVLAFLCAIAKVSVGFYLAVVLGWLAWRRRMPLAQRAGILLALGGLLFCTWRYLRPDEVSLLDAGLNPLYYSYLQYFGFATLVTFLVPALVLAWQVLALRLTHASADAGTARWQLGYLPASGWGPALRRLGDADGYVQLLALVLLASWLVLFTVPVGSNVAYFTGVLLFLCACRAPGWFDKAWQGLPGWCRRHRAVCLVMLLVVATSQVSGFLKDFARQTAALVRAEERQSVYWDQTEIARRNTPLVLDTMRQSWRDSRSPFAALQARIAQTPWSQMLHRLDSLRSQGQRVVVHVPPSNEAFWARLKGGSPYWCLSAHLMVPADLGVPMLRGIGSRARERECMPGGQIWYGFGKEQEQHRSVALDDAKLCGLARQGGFTAVYVLQDIWLPDNNRVLACPPGKNP